MNRLWLISYDMADDRRRRRVEKLLLRLGDRSLESLFECPLSAEQARVLAQRLARRVQPQADSVALIPMCRDCQRALREWGLGRQEDSPGRLPRPHYTVL